VIKTPIAKITSDGIYIARGDDGAPFLNTEVVRESDPDDVADALAEEDEEDDELPGDVT
jgi:hypothetical protein